MCYGTVQSGCPLSTGGSTSGTSGSDGSSSGSSSIAVAVVVVVVVAVNPDASFNIFHRFKWFRPCGCSCASGLGSGFTLVPCFGAGLDLAPIILPIWRAFRSRSLLGVDH